MRPAWCWAGTAGCGCVGLTKVSICIVRMWICAFACGCWAESFGAVSCLSSMRARGRAGAACAMAHGTWPACCGCGAVRPTARPEPCRRQRPRCAACMGSYRDLDGGIGLHGVLHRLCTAGALGRAVLDVLLRIRQAAALSHRRGTPAWGRADVPRAGCLLGGGHLAERSEEHTSELQSHLNLVCRLLLEKKKITTLRLSHARRGLPPRRSYLP